MNKYIFLLFILFFQTVSAQQKNGLSLYETSHYKIRMEQFQTEGLQQNKIVFLGNSLTEGGDWAARFPKQYPVNRGISGDNTEGVLARLSEILKTNPAKLFLMIGINDISQNYNNDYLCRNFEKIQYVNLYPLF